MWLERMLVSHMLQHSESRDYISLIVFFRHDYYYSVLYVSSWRGMDRVSIYGVLVSPIVFQLLFFVFFVSVIILPIRARGIIHSVQ